MGIFSWIGDAAKTVCKAAGIEFSPSGILGAVGDLTNTISEAIPGIGPVISHAIPALTSVFGDSQRSSVAGADMEVAHFVTNTTAMLTKVQSQIGDLQTALATSQTAVQTAITTSQNTVVNAIDASQKAIQDGIEKTQLQNLQISLQVYYSTLDGAIGFLGDQATNLQSILPASGEDALRPFIGSNNPSLIEHRNRLDDQMHTMATKLTMWLGSNESMLTREAVDLYMLTVAWLLMLDKAQDYLSSDQIGKYIGCMTQWNQEFNTSRAHIKSAISFLFGPNAGVSATYDAEHPGYLARLRKARAASISLVDGSNAAGTLTKESVIQDSWHVTAFGYAGAGTGDGKLQVTQTITLPTGAKSDVDGLMWKNTCVPLYETVNLNYFDIAAQHIVDIAEKWQDCLVKWNGRVPAMPPALLPARDQEPATKITHIQPSVVEGRDKTKGYKSSTTVAYALSYVTAQGEGSLSVWSDSTNIHDSARCVNLKFYPVTLLTDVYRDFGTVASQNKGASGKGLDTIRRVYVRYKETGEDEKYAWLADLTSHDSELVDLGVEFHGKLNDASKVSAPDLGPTDK